MEDVTKKLLADTGTGPDAKRMLKAKPAKALDDRLMAVIQSLRAADVTMGFVSKPLVYSHLFRSKPIAIRTALYRLLKGNFLVVLQHREAPAEDSYARRDTPYGNDRYYELAMNPAKF
jgi:hypothetical protein